MAGTVGSIMTPDVAVAAPGDTVADVAHLLMSHEISAVPVCDEGGCLLGMVSAGDLMRPFETGHGLRRDWWLGLVAEGPDLASEFVAYLGTKRRSACDVMTTGVHTVAEDATLPEAASLMLRHDVKRLPVMRNGTMVGIISRADLVRALSGIDPSRLGTTREIPAIAEPSQAQPSQVQLAWFPSAP